MDSTPQWVTWETTKVPMSKPQVPDPATVAGGQYTATFWSLVVIAGLLVPLLLESLEARRQLRHTAIAPVLLLVGGLSLRWILVLAGQA